MFTRRGLRWYTLASSCFIDMFTRPAPWFDGWGDLNYVCARRNIIQNRGTVELPKISL